MFGTISFLSFCLFITILTSQIVCIMTTNSKLQTPHTLRNSVEFIGDLALQIFKDCNFFIVDGNFDPSSRFMWKDTFEELAANKKITNNSGGLYNIRLDRNKTEFTKLHRPDKIGSNSCSVTVILVPAQVNEQEDLILSERLEKPLKNPVTIKNKDKYFILTEIHNIDTLYKSQLISSLKFQLVLTEDNTGDVFAHRFCPFCPQGRIKSFKVNPKGTGDINYFPDIYWNYYGSVLKTSASDKLNGLLGIEKIGDNKYIAKRGVYAYALFHLVEKLNFTYKLIPSSGGGSTGHPLPNGTWLGTVGDTLSGITDFGLMAGMTYIRFPWVDLSATITFEYISFATGPPAKLYAISAIFWPFSLSIWVALIITLSVTIIASFLIIKFETRKCTWNIKTIAQYYGRTFIEQGDELPTTLPESVRILFGFYLLFALVGATAYKSKLVSFMTFPVLQELPNTFDDLAKSHFDIAFHYFGNVAYNTFKTSSNPQIVNIFNRMRKEPNPLNCLKKTMDSHSACILFGCVYEELRYRNLSNRFGRTPIRISPNYGFMYGPGVLTRKKAALSNNFKWVINNAMEMGLLMFWQKADLREILKNKNKWEKESHQQSFVTSSNDDGEDVLHLPNLIGSFTILLGGISTAIVAFIYEHIAFIRHQKRIFIRLDIVCIIQKRILNFFSVEKKINSYY